MVIIIIIVMMTMTMIMIIGRRATLINGEPRWLSIFLFQQLSVATQRTNAVAFLNTVDPVAVMPSLALQVAVV